jgi:hypothetical protein
MSKPTIYLYKVTFEEIADFYWGIHKEKKAGECYLGSPVTHAWKWEFYTPKVNVCQEFDYTDEGWKQALQVEKRVILHDWDNPLCLNDACGGTPSLRVLRESGRKTSEILMREKDERGKCKHYVEMRRKVKNLRSGDNSIRMNEVVHSERNEEGKSLHAIKANEALHRDRDEDGKSLHTLKLHQQKDDDGKSAHAKKMAEARWGKRKT